jgi:hypothetical protein
MTWLEEKSNSRVDIGNVASCMSNRERKHGSRVFHTSQIPLCRTPRLHGFEKKTIARDVAFVSDHDNSSGNKT